MVSTSLGGNLRMITGLGGNIAVLEGDDGSLVIDSGLADAAPKTAAEVGKSGPIALLVNTHWHYDHAGGNEALSRAGARVMAHHNCHRRMSAEHYLEPLDRTMPASPPGALPRVTFGSETALHLNGEFTRLIPVPPAHTDGDVVVVFQKADVIHAGDLFFNGSYPFIDYSSGGWIGGLVEATRTVLEAGNLKTRFIPGHGPVASYYEFRSYIRFLENIHDRLERLQAQGKTVDEVVAAAPTSDYDEHRGKGFLSPEKFVRITYAGLLKHKK